MPFAMALYLPMEALAFAGWHFPGLLHDTNFAPPPPAPAAAQQCSSPLSSSFSWATSLIASMRNPSHWRKPSEFSALSCAAWLYYVLCDILVQAERCYRLTALLHKLRHDQQPASASASPALAAVPRSAATLTSPSLTTITATPSQGSRDLSSPPDTNTNTNTSKGQREGHRERLQHVQHELETQLLASQLQLLRELLCVLPAFAWSWADFSTNSKVPRPLINLLMWLESLLAFSGKLHAQGRAQAHGG